MRDNENEKVHLKMRIRLDNTNTRLLCAKSVKNTLKKVYR